MTDKQQIQNANQALSVLVQGVELAQKRGAYNLEEAALLSQAVKLFSDTSTTPAEPAQSTTQEVDETES
tara:strand:- start:3324 stop:3530 length:207 start_codon:yes stop_codon:yes gene_type:complete